MSTAVIELVKQASGLSTAEKLELAMAMLEQTRATIEPQKSLLKWRDIRGIYPNLLDGEDAQAWVNRMRDEWDEREKQWSKPQ